MKEWSRVNRGIECQKAASKDLSIPEFAIVVTDLLDLIRPRIIREYAMTMMKLITATKMLIKR